MKQIFYAAPSRGQPGLAIVGPDGMTLPAQGALSHVSDEGGMSTYRIDPGETGAWVIVAGDVTARAGARVETVKTLGLKIVSLLVLGPQAVIEHHTRDRKSSRIVVYLNGVEANIPVSVLVAAGVLDGKGQAQDVEGPPELSDALEMAFALLQDDHGVPAQPVPPREKRKYNKRKPK